MGEIIYLVYGAGVQNVNTWLKVYVQDVTGNLYDIVWPHVKA